MRELLRDLVWPFCLLVIILGTFAVLSWKNDVQDRQIWRLQQEVSAFVIPQGCP